jgi:hypothetical protein
VEGSHSEVLHFIFKQLGSTDKKLYHRISVQDIEFNEGVSLEAKLLVSQLLCKEPGLRPDIDKVPLH